MTKPYYETLWAKTEGLGMYEEPSKAFRFVGGKGWMNCLLTRILVGVLEFMERQGEGCSYRQAYLDGGRKMD